MQWVSLGQVAHEAIALVYTCDPAICVYAQVRPQGWVCDCVMSEHDEPCCTIEPQHVISIPSAN